MEEIVVYVHGKGGSAQEAEHYKALFPNCEVIGFDYHAQSPWEATEEFSGFFTAVRKRCGKLTLVANSIGAFFSFASLNEKLVDASYFISPVVDMEQLICNMMRWAGVSEAELAEKLEIPTTFGETLSWEYLCYVRELMSRDELAVMDGSKCILQLRGVRPFLSDKFDITKHKRYKELSDFDKKNEFDIERYLKHELRLLTTEEFDLYEVDATEQAQG